MADETEDGSCLNAPEVVVAAVRTPGDEPFGQGHAHVAEFDAGGALTRDFLLRRGRCCSEGCANCPYGFGVPHKLVSQVQGTGRNVQIAPMKVMVVALVGSIAFYSSAPRAEASNPVGDFFRRVGRSISKQPRKTAPRPQPRRANASRAKGTSAAAPSPSPSPLSAAATDPAQSPPAEPMPTPPQTRVASIAPPSARRQDLPYALPIPSRPGFVTSPYAPTRGYVDVRDFASGTEVKDPYTGKLFLIP